MFSLSGTTPSPFPSVKTPSLSPSTRKGEKKKILSIHQKYEIIQDHVACSTDGQVCSEKIPLHDLIKAKEKTKEVMKGMESAKKSKEMFRKRQLPMDKLD
ncbi:hypothetical protein Pcinc_024306 [Petrolisthes cinctipes]|uniref:Uncharacterized protein n=1 Tax=Petrolisthes cinctipes TaxID=88211 RepID=A0AAE1KAK5_PETCI|nr:hypothetical protein Pcinc_026108 [Petrolisthes cinctipes]KAK3870483.1 hypothetical protein Pcinc_024306 [Petrolisthes cinctipes]